MSPYIDDAFARVDGLTRPVLERLDVLSSEALSALRKLDNPAAKQLVALLGHDRVQQAQAHLVKNQTLVIQLVFTALLFAFQARVLNRRAKERQRLLDQQESGMVDFGLGGLGSSGASKDNGEVEVHWGREKFRVPLPPPSSPLSALKATLFNMTGVPPDHQKLILSGAVLRDDLAPLSSFNLVDAEAAPAGSSTTSFWDSWSFKSSKKANVKKLMMLGTKDVSARVDDKLATRSDLKIVQQLEEQQAQAEKPKDDEPTIVGRIDALVQSALTEWEPKIVGLETYLKQRLGKTGAGEPADPAADPKEEEAEIEAPNPRTAAWLSEVLLQSLLKLDSIDIPSAFTTARKERKDAVRKLQGCLDRVDAYTSANAKL